MVTTRGKHLLLAARQVADRLSQSLVRGVSLRTGPGMGPINSSLLLASLRSLSHYGTAGAGTGSQQPLLPDVERPPGGRGEQVLHEGDLGTGSEIARKPGANAASTGTSGRGRSAALAGKIAARDGGSGALQRGLQLLSVIETISPGNERYFGMMIKAQECFHVALSEDPDDARAMLALARLHLDYDGPVQAPENGAALLLQAAEMQLPEAQYELGCRLRGHAGAISEVTAERARAAICQRVPDPVHLSLEYLEAAAKQSHPHALLLVGAAYFAGHTVVQDLKKAETCFAEAADLGLAEAAAVYGAFVAKGLSCLYRPLGAISPSANRSSGGGERGSGTAAVMSEDQNETHAQRGTDGESNGHGPEPLDEGRSMDGEMECDRQGGLHDDAKKHLDVARMLFEQAAADGNEVASAWLRLGEFQSQNMMGRTAPSS